MFDCQAAYKDLEQLHQAASETEGWSGEQSATFIRVGEYSFALDEIAYAFLSRKARMPDQLFQIFEKLVIAMKLDRDPEYEGRCYVS